MSDRLEGIAVITGAASGIGLATAQLFAARGAQLVLLDLDAGALEAITSGTLAGSVIASLAVDVAATDTPARLGAALSGLEAPRYLINNAGIAASPPLTAATDADLDRFLSVNVASVFRLCRQIIPMMQPAGGAIVNVSSVFGLTGVTAVPVYAMTKGAVAALTLQLATDFGRDGIRVNAVAPGLIDTPLTAQRIRAGARTQKHMMDEAPLGRAGTPGDVAEAIGFLASDRASFITGEILKVDGGWTTARLPPARLPEA